MKKESGSNSFGDTDRRRFDEALHESEEKFLKAFRFSPNPMVITSMDGIFVEVNNSFLAFIGRKRKNVIGRSAGELRIWEDIEDRKRIMRMLRKQKSVRNIEARLYGKGRDVRTGLYSAELISLCDKPHVLSVFSDITERQQAEEALRNSEERYRGLVESQNDLIVRVDSKNRFTFINDAYCRKFGKKREELLGRTFMPLVHKDDLPATLKAMEGLKVPPYRIKVEQRALTPKGWRWFEWEDYAIMNNLGKISEIQAVGHDITENKNAEEEIRSVKDHLQTVLNSIDEALVVVDKRYRIVSHNQAFVKSLRRMKRSIIGEPCFKVIHGFVAPCRNCVVRDMFRTGKPTHDVHYHFVKRGKIFHEVKAYPIRDIAGRITQSIYVFMDVTQRENMYERIREANLRLAEVNRMKSDFVSIASHELRTPLAIIKGYVDLMEDGILGGVNSRQKEKLDAISKNIKHLDRMVNDILDLSRIDAGEMKLTLKRTDLDQLASGVVEDFRDIAEDKMVNLEFRGWGSNVKARVDGDRIKQVLTNLIDNAIKFTPSGGGVWVRIDRRRNNAVIEVGDTGIGIPKRSIPGVFERFYQADSSVRREYKGVGLGLPICKSIVELHGGSIRIESKVGSGTVVTVKLPLLLV